MRNLILLAAPAAGKGTLSENLREKYGYVSISTGDLLRNAVANGHELGPKIHEMQMSGALVTNEIVYQLLEDRINESDCKNGYILDGFPRNIEQAEEYDKLIKEMNKDLGIAILLDIEKEELKVRTVGRRTCKDCGSIHNIYKEALLPKKEGICNKCGGELIQRSDDTEEMLEIRYQTYLDKTKPLIDYYNEKGILYTVDSGKTPAYTLEQVEAILNGLGDSVDNN